jgi:hypothetical protein
MSKSGGKAASEKPFNRVPLKSNPLIGRVRSPNVREGRIRKHS